jgi:hypothetical protein
MKYVLDSSFQQEDPDFNKTGSFLNEYYEKKTVAPILHLYTLQTSFYPALKDTSKCATFTMLLYRNLSQLTERFFKGRTYRGVIMTKNDLGAYHSILRHKGNALMNTKFQSSSKELSVAEGFLLSTDMSEDNSDRQYRVLMIFDFHEICQSAINLTQVNGKYLTEYPHEAEVLILPYTLFEVCDVKYDTTKQYYTIHLRNIVPPGIISSFKRAMKAFMTMSSEDLHQSMRRMENNLNAIKDMTQNNSN